MSHSFRELIDKEVQRAVLEQVLPKEGRDAVSMGLLHVHSLGDYLEPDVVTLELRQLSFADPLVHTMGLWRHLKRTSTNTTKVIGAFSTDIGHSWCGFSHGRSPEPYLREFFSCLTEEPRVRVTINVGDDGDDSLVGFTRAVLAVLGEGQTYLEPQLVFRVRRGVNLEPSTAAHYLLRGALEHARTRKGISFALLDSPMNAQWMGLQSFDAYGLRIEPQALDLYFGTRGQSIPARVSINVPAALSFGPECLLGMVELSARLLAHRLELLSLGRAATHAKSPLIINLCAIRELPSQDQFTLLHQLNAAVRQLSSLYNLNFALSSTSERVAFAYSEQTGRMPALDPVSAASLDPLLPGGHCLVIPSGPHLTCEELYAQLLEIERAGVSFVRFEVEDVRCSTCHLSVAAAGACPACGGEKRRKICEQGTRLEEEIVG